MTEPIEIRMEPGGAPPGVWEVGRRIEETERSEDNQLRRVAVYICDGCLQHRPGQCHMPGCIFIRWGIEDVPDLRHVVEVLGHADV